MTQLETGKNKQKNRFIELRANGCSYASIAKELQVSKATLTNWNSELSGVIAKQKVLQLEELYEEYYLLKEGRIKLLGGIVKRLEEEASKRDLSELKTDKLFDQLLKYHNELKEEFVDLPEDKIGTKLNAEAILQELIHVLSRYRAGEITKEQAYKENTILGNILKAYETNTLEKKVDAISAIMTERN